MKVLLQITIGGYEGAIVLKPQLVFILKNQLQFYAIMYVVHPSSMISENLSHDSIILEDNEDSKKYLGDDGIAELDKIGYDHVDVTHDVYKWINPNIKSKGKEKVGIKTCRFAQPRDGSKSIIPDILKKLLKARKDTRKKIVFKTIVYNDPEDSTEKSFSGLYDEKDGKHIVSTLSGEKVTVDDANKISIKDTYNDFEKTVFDGLQLAFKITANSLYGQIGARTSPIYLKDIAASTTAITDGNYFILQRIKQRNISKMPRLYGDTDSIFINFNPKDENGNPLKIVKHSKNQLKWELMLKNTFNNF